MNANVNARDFLSIQAEADAIREVLWKASPEALGLIFKNIPSADYTATGRSVRRIPTALVAALAGPVWKTPNGAKFNKKQDIMTVCNSFKGDDFTLAETISGARDLPS